MKPPESATLYTIGHSTRTIEEFLELLFSFDIKILADIRRLPGSRKYPQFDQDALKKSLEENGIVYIYIADLGGRRPAKKDSKIQLGEINLFKVTPIIWKPNPLQMLPPNWQSLHWRNRLR